MEHEIRVYNDPEEDLEDDLLPEYDFDYSKAKPNPYAAQAARQPDAQEGGETPPLQTENNS